MTYLVHLEGLKETMCVYTLLYILCIAQMKHKSKIHSNFKGINRLTILMFLRM